jgi:rhamnogalacturonan endolyase
MAIMRSLGPLAGSLLLPAVLAVTATFSRAADAPPATATDDGKSMVLENGLLFLTLGKRGGQGTSIKFRRDGRDVELAAGRSVLYFDVGGGRVYPIKEADGEVLRKGPDLVEAAWNARATDAFPFETEFHCLLRRGDSGFHLYAVYRHGAGMGAGGIGETRFVIKGTPGPSLFTHHVVDDRRKGPYPTAKQVETVQDATFRLDDGTVYTKYDNSAYLAEHHVHGMAGHGVGMWMIFPSNEFIGGGPFKQELTVHKENVLLGMLVGGHFGSGGLHFRKDEAWEKVYGPLFVYVNAADSVDKMWDDAKTRANAEIAKWPYEWLARKEYPLKRGTVSGSIKLTDGTSAKGAWVLLSPPGEDWTQVLKGFDFWARADDRGRFTLAKVRPGRYTLTLVGANQFEEFRRENVEVKEGANDLGELSWKPVTHGRTLWQIGVADRSSAEFKGGDNYRHYDNFLRYAKEFPDDVTYTVGKSKEAEDWNFAQWAVYSKRPHWTIRFEQAEDARGKATLTIGLVSSHPPRGARTNLEVKVNGQVVDVLRLPKTGTAGYRSGGGDSPYHVVHVTFDAARLKKGTNEITLGHTEAVPAAEHRRGVPGQVMYDALRLEVNPEESDKPAGPRHPVASFPP